MKNIIGEGRGEEGGGLLTFFPWKGGGVIRGGAYLRGGLNREFTVPNFFHYQVMGSRLEGSLLSKQVSYNWEWRRIWWFPEESGNILDSLCWLLFTGNKSARNVVKNLVEKAREIFNTTFFSFLFLWQGWCLCRRTLLGFTLLLSGK